MEYQKIINFLDNTPNQSPKFSTKIWVEMMMNHDERMTLVDKVDLKIQC